MYILFLNEFDACDELNTDFWCGTKWLFIKGVFLVNLYTEWENNVERLESCFVVYI